MFGPYSVIRTWVEDHNFGWLSVRLAGRPLITQRQSWLHWWLWQPPSCVSSSLRPWPQSPDVAMICFASKEKWAIGGEGSRVELHNVHMSVHVFLISISETGHHRCWMYRYRGSVRKLQIPVLLSNSLVGFGLSFCTCEVGVMLCKTVLLCQVGKVTHLLFSLQKFF